MVFFVTGITGFIGGEVLVNLAGRREVERIYCLVRAGSHEAAMTRLRKVFLLHGDTFDEGRIVPVVGDLTDGGLAETLAHDPRLAGVTHVVHSAANTSFGRGHDDAVERVNIHGLRSILEWSAKLADLELFTYVGTATIRGKGVTHRVILEDESPDPHARHLVKYTSSKSDGELMLRQYLPEHKVLVVRPSIVMGDSRNPVPRSNVILWALAAENLLRMGPVDGEARLDIVPVDYASRAIVALLFARRHHQVYHISSGAAGATTSRLLTDAIAPFFPPSPPHVYVAREWIGQMRAWARGRLAADSPLHAYPAHLEHWLRVLDGDPQKMRILLAGWEPYLRFIELGHVFDNTRLLADTDVGQAPAGHEYIARCAGFLAGIDVFEGALDP
jgi:thioester reductase-like protein